MAAVDQHRELDLRRAAVVEDLVDRGADGAAGVEDVVDDHDRAAVDRELELARVDDRRARPERSEVVAVEADVDEAERDPRLQELAGQRLQPLREDRAAAVDADDRDAGIRVGG